MVDDDALEVADEEVADDAQRQLGLLVDERGRVRPARAAADRRPELQQELEIAGELLLRGAFRGGADDQPALRQLEPLADLLQPLALVVLEPARDADPVPVRRVDEEAAGERDLRRQPRALRPHGILDRLDEDLLAAGDELLDALAVALSLELGDDDLVDVQEPVALEADVHERRLHAREHVVDDTLVDVPGNRAALGTAEIDLGGLAVFENGDRLLAHVDGDVDLLRDVRKGDPRRRRGRLACRRTLALALRRRLALRLRLAGLGLLGLLGSRSRRRRGLGLLLRATAAAAASAAPAGRLSVSRLGGIPPSRLLLCGRLGSGCLFRRRLPALLPAKPGHVC